MQNEEKKRIGLHVFNPFYSAQLQPVFEHLKDRHPCLITEDLKDLLAFRPHILVVADNRYYLYRRHLPGTVIIWVRHGLAGKNIVRPSIEGADFACVSSEWFEDHYKKSGIHPRLGYWQTGFVAMDTFFGSGMYPSMSLPAGLKNGNKTVLYAPTWNRYLSSMEMVERSWIESLLRECGTINLVIKPHPHIPRLFPHVMAEWKATAVNNPERVFLVEDAATSVYAYFHLSDMMIGDASSVFLYYLAVDKPLVLINNPRRRLDQSFFDARGPEWQWRDCALEVETRTALLQAVGKCLEQPSHKSDRRSVYRKRIYGSMMDGRSAERVAKKIAALAASAKQQEPWVEKAWEHMRAWELRNKEDKWKHWFFEQFMSIGYFLERFPRIKHLLNQWRKRFIKGI